MNSDNPLTGIINITRYSPRRLSVCLSVCLSACLSVCFSVYLSVFLSVCLVVCLSVCPSVYLFDRPAANAARANVLRTAGVHNYKRLLFHVEIHVET